jgi:hypothetical protein
VTPILALNNKKSNENALEAKKILFTGRSKWKFQTAISVLKNPEKNYI